MPPEPLAVYAATRVPGPDQQVVRGRKPISDADAIALLQAAKDIVVCGGTQEEREQKARELMTAAWGGYLRGKAEKGRMALPHFHPPNYTPDATHAFYDTDRRYAKR